MKPYKLFFFFLLLFYVPVGAQQPFRAFPENNENLYHLDFKQYFSSPEEAAKAYTEVIKESGQLEKYKGYAVQGPKKLLVFLKTWDDLLKKLFHAYIYFNLKYSVNNTDIESRRMSENIDALIAEKDGLVTAEINHLGMPAFSVFLKTEPGLQPYAFYIKDLQRLKAHQLPAESEKIVGLLRPVTSGWQFDLYRQIGGTLRFDSIKVNTFRFHPARDNSVITTHPDSVVRAEGFKKLYASYHQSGFLYAFDLIKVVEAQDAIAKIGGFANAAEASYHGKYYTGEAINSLLHQIRDSVYIFKKYQQLRKDFAAKKTGLSDIHYWDMPLANNTLLMKWNIDSASSIATKVLSPLGNGFREILADILNPSNRRMEIAPDPKKRSGGFSRGFIGTNSIFYSGTYRGDYNDMRVITHEITHAIHRDLMNKNQVLPIYASGPNYLFESFAIFSEFLLSDYLISHAKSDDEKRFYLEQLFENKGMIIFSAGLDAMLEQSIHEGIMQGKIRNEKDLDSLNAKINGWFSIWQPEKYPELNHRWITANLLYEDPFYNINYVLGALLALNFLDQIHRDKVSFTDKYERLLKNGFNGTPEELLRNFLNIDINNPKSLGDAINVVRPYLAMYESLK
jgi:oligoendopeptidase F